MPLPSNPSDGQTATLRGITYTYSSASDSWSISTLYSNTAAFTTINGNLQAPGAIFNGTDSIKVPVGNTAQRPSSATGQLRFNSDLNVFEGYNGTIWGSIGGGAKIQDTAPSNPIEGDLWWKSDEGQLYIYYSDGSSNQWVIASSFAGSGGYLPITGGNLTGNLSTTGTLSVTGNANVGNLGTTTAVVTTANLTTINSGLIQNGNSNITIDANSSIRVATNGNANVFTVNADGNVGIGTATPSTKIHVSSGTVLIQNNQDITPDATWTSAQLKITGNGYSGGLAFDDTGMYVGHNSSARAVILETDALPRFRVDGSGNILFGMASASTSLAGVWGYSTLTYGRLNFVKSTASGTGATSSAVFYYNGTGVGSITNTSTATAFNTTSDYRLKTNLEPLSNAIDRLKELKPYRFNWIAAPDQPKVDGFIAHEAAEVVPESIVGIKDAVDEDGNIDPQGIDQSKLVPLLAAALQEAIAKIETLEIEVAQLKGIN